MYGNSRTTHLCSLQTRGGTAAVWCTAVPQTSASTPPTPSAFSAARSSATRWKLNFVRPRMKRSLGSQQEQKKQGASQQEQRTKKKQGASNRVAWLQNLCGESMYALYVVRGSGLLAYGRARTSQKPYTVWAQPKKVLTVPSFNVHGLSPHRAMGSCARQGH